MDGVLKRKAVGAHVFAGGLTGGVKAAGWDVTHQLESHGFGLATASKVWGAEVVDARHPCDWPRTSGDMLYGNPRCSGFSATMCGRGENVHGPRAHQCQDILDLMSYGIACEFPVIVWESVQQAYSTGRELVRELVERCVTNGYRVAHVFVNAMTFGVCQSRKRYFFVAYPGGMQFNVGVPDVSDWRSTLYDAVWDARSRETREVKMAETDYDRDCYPRLSAEERAMVPVLPSGWNVNVLAEYDWEACPPRVRARWDARASTLPFGFHSIHRTSWMLPSPTLTKGCFRLIHPWHHRPFTVGELSSIMGWGERVPVGKDPYAQLAKGVCPAVGEWMARQVDACLSDAWGGEEWTTRYDAYEGKFVGEDSRGADEKVIDITEYRGHDHSLDRFPDACREQFHRFNVDPVTGKIKKSWQDVRRRA